MTEILTYREEAQKAFLDFFATMTGLPIGLYESRDGQLVGVLPESSLDRFEPHCRLIQSFPGGKAACKRDQCNRAQRIFRLQEEDELTLCYAGLYNQAIPIRLDGEVRAVLLYGEMQIDDDEYKRRSLERHERAVARLDLNEKQAVRLRELLRQAKSYTPEQLEKLKMMLPKVERWFYSMMDEEQRVKHHVEKVTRELQTRLQAVIAHAENLMLEARNLTPPDVYRRSNDVLSASEALATVVQNLGQFMEEYRFEKQLINPLINEARRLYHTEAAARGIVIHVNLATVDGSSPKLEVSRHHLQLAFNNLVHNAVKYSFRAGPGRSRYVRIMGRPLQQYYSLVFENYGVGMLPEEIETGYIFEDGTQGELTQGEYRTGSGKGLFFVKRVVERHHGSIQVQSCLVSDAVNPEGEPHLNQFTVYLPYEQPKENARHVQDSHMD